jgi:hypothetical protein
MVIDGRTKRHARLALTKLDQAPRLAAPHLASEQKEKKENLVSMQ